MVQQRVRRPALLAHGSPFLFVILLGLVSLFGDVVYEGARSISGPYLASMGATATTIGLIAGFGELIGYALRLVSGRLTDKTKQYWPIIFVGYALNLLPIPALALATNWLGAAALMVAERVGKAVRAPARDLVLSDAAYGMGTGTAFGLHQALDQIGAIMGPLLVAAILVSTHSFQMAFAVMLVPSLLALIVLMVARDNCVPHHVEDEVGSQKLSKTFWIYTAGMALLAAGYVDFPLIAYHMYKELHIASSMVPIYYSGAMAMEAIVSYPLGRLFDRVGLPVVVGVACVSIFATPLAFSSSSWSLIVGILVWGTGMAAQNSIAKAAISKFVAHNERGNAFGVYGTTYGVAWFFGSALMGFLYDHNLAYMVAFSIFVQLAALPVLLYVAKLTVKR